MRHSVSGFLALIFSLSSFAAEDAPGIESLMTKEELRETGLDGLSDRQIDALNAWLDR
jgi:hypothetical protein